MRIYHFELPKLGHGMSGGEHCLLEVIRYLKSQRIQNVLLTTDNGRSTYESLGFYEDEFLRYVTIPAACVEQRAGALISYIVRTISALRLMNHLRIEDDAVLLCNSDSFPNAIPFRLLAYRQPHAKLIYWFRMLAPDLWKGYVGHYLGTHHIPTLRLAYFRLNQWLYRKLILPKGILLVSNPSYAPILRRQLPKNPIHVLRRYTGRPDLHFAPDAPKDFDLAWLGRFHPQKGLFEMLDVVRRLKVDRPTVKIVVIGGGDPRMIRKFRRQVSRDNLENNVDYRGYISDSTRYAWLSRARLFLMTSYFEGYPNVVVEAMSAGLPVLAYDLPFYAPFSGGMIRVAARDNAAVASAALELLRDENKRRALAKTALQASYGFSWETVGAEILALAENAAGA